MYNIYIIYIYYYITYIHMRGMVVWALSAIVADLLVSRGC